MESQLQKAIQIVEDMDRETLEFDIKDLGALLDDALTVPPLGGSDGTIGKELFTLLRLLQNKGEAYRTAIALVEAKIGRR